MTWAETAEAIQVMQEYVDHKEVESRSRDSTDWVKCTLPAWDWDHFQYRVDMPPLEAWANVYPGKVPYCYMTEQEAASSLGCGGRTIKVREVRK